MSDMHAAFADFLAAARARPPEVALVLGSGLGDLADRLADARAVPFHEIPDLPAPSVHGHRGQLLLGRWGKREVLLFAGRVHYYEGHPWRGVLQPVRLAHQLGVKTLILTNAVGGIRDDLGPGSLVAVTDHMECTRAHWYRQPGPGGFGGARPSPYSAALRERVLAAARARGEHLATGIYAQVTGPSYETPAEVRALRSCGADVVGMSTAREIQTGHDLGLECAAISCVCNKASGLADGPIHHGEVLDIAARLRSRLTAILDEYLAT
jgi:purine-nucleoside phosphorylase